MNDANILINNKNSNLDTFLNCKINHNPSKKRESNILCLIHNFTNNMVSLIKDINSKIEIQNIHLMKNFKNNGLYRGKRYTIQKSQY